MKTCEACQFHAKNIHQPAQALQTIPLSWSFAVWGLDIIGELPRAVGGYRYLIVLIDKFTKWVEVEPVRAITAQAAIKAVQGVVARFGVPNRIITNLGSQFTSGPFQAYCSEMGTKICYASVAHPRSNGQVERRAVGLERAACELRAQVGDDAVRHTEPGHNSLDSLDRRLRSNSPD